MQSTKPEDHRNRARLRSRKCERHRASLESIFWCATNPPPNIEPSSLGQREIDRKSIEHSYIYLAISKGIDWIFATHIHCTEDHLWRPFARRCRLERSFASPICEVARLVHCAKAKPLTDAAQMPTGLPSIPLSQHDKNKSKSTELAPAAG